MNPVAEQRYQLINKNPNSEDQSESETCPLNPLLDDFMLSIKVPRSSHLLHGEDRVQNVSRYVVSKNGKQLTKVMPPLAKKPDVWRRIGVESGWNVTICNDAREVAGAEIEFDYYIREVEKLVNGLA